MQENNNNNNGVVVSSLPNFADMARKAEAEVAAKMQEVLRLTMESLYQKELPNFFGEKLTVGALVQKIQGLQGQEDPNSNMFLQFLMGQEITLASRKTIVIKKEEKNYPADIPLSKTFLLDLLKANPYQIGVLSDKINELRPGIQACPENVKKHLQGLLEAKAIVTAGKGRGVHYFVPGSPAESKLPQPKADDTSDADDTSTVEASAPTETVAPSDPAGETEVIVVNLD